VHDFIKSFAIYGWCKHLCPQKKIGNKRKRLTNSEKNQKNREILFDIGNGNRAHAI